MTADPANAVILFVSAVHNATALGVPTSISAEEPHEDVIVRDVGVTGPSAVGEVASDLIAVVDFLVKGWIAPSVAAANLVFTGYDTAGNSITYTLPSMKPRTKAFEFNRNSPPGVNRQRFRHVGSTPSMT